MEKENLRYSSNPVNSISPTNSNHSVNSTYSTSSIKCILTIVFCLWTLISFCQNEEISFSPGVGLTEKFYSFVDNVGKDYSKDDVQNTKNVFKEIISNGKFDYYYEEQLCNLLNCLYLQNSNFPIVKTFVSAYLNMLHSNFKEEDCKNWVNTTCNIKPDIQLFNLWQEFFKDNTISLTSYSKWMIIDPQKIELKYINETPYAVFEKGILTCPSNDSIKVHDCSGRINLLTKELTGRGGFIYWEKAGMHRDSVFAKLPAKYELILDNITITIESVELYHKKYFPGTALLGSVTDRCIQGSNVTNARYPKFNAYSENPLAIRNIYKDMNYLGGFAIDGNQINGSAYKDRDAEIVIYHEGKIAVRLESKRFNFRKDGFFTNKVRFVLYTPSDTISHADASVRYTTINNELDITRDADKRGGAPFSTIRHRLNIYSDHLRWKLDTDNIVFTSTSFFSKEGSAFFESKNFFSKDRFRQFETVDGTNSVLQVLQFTRKYSTKFHLYEYAEFCKKSYDQVKTSLLLLSNFELIDYDLETDSVKVNKKLQDYVAAYSENRDYDVISIYSKVKDMDNAVMDYKGGLLTIYGVDELIFSDKNNVVLFPTNHKIKVWNELTMEFDGYLQAGLIDFYVHSGVFDYHKFNMNLSQIDSMSFFINTGQIDQHGQPIVSKVNSPIQNLSGILELDEYFNKSGNLDNPEFPKFTCDNYAHIYYDNVAICNGVYNRDEFYFLVDPFSIDSLQSFIPQHLYLDGEFVSAGIFPNFREKATIMDDLSLGFIHKTPSSGYPMYGGKGKFFNTIVLSNNCLIGKGQIDYLTASLKSEEFAIYPDSVNSIVERLNIDKLISKVEYPQVYGNTSKMYWNVNENYMDFNTVAGDPYYMFNNFLSLDGNLLYSPEYLKGKGVITKDNGVISSNNIEFKAHSFYADTSNFQLYLPGNKYIAVDVENYNVALNVNAQKSIFRANDLKECGLNFKENAYFVKFDKFEWQINKNSLSLGDSDYAASVLNETTLNRMLDNGAGGYQATALSKKAESLQFNTRSGVYDGDSFVLSLNDIDYIEVSDAAVFPSDGSVKITAGGTMMPINDGFIVLNIDKRYFTLYNINATIESKNVLKGTGYFDYVDVGGNVTPVFVESISSTKDQVRGRAVISELRPILLNPVVEYQGIVSMYSNSPMLDFNGHYNIKQVCFENKTWIRLDYGVDPEDILLPTNKKIMSMDNKPIFSGLMFSNPGANLYPAFVSSKRKIPDVPLFNVEGLLSFKNNVYTITDTVGNSYFAKKNLTLSLNNCIMKGSGEFEFLENPGRLTIQSAGDLNYNLSNDSVSLDISIFLDFHFNNYAMKIMTEDIQYSIQYEDRKVKTVNNYNAALSYLLPKDEFNSYFDEIASYGFSHVTPQLLQSKIIISNTKFVWNDSEKVFYSVGPITIASVNGQQLNRSLKGAVEISKFGGTESISIMFLTVNPETRQEEKYFFFYNNYSMFTYSTNDHFTDVIRADNKKTRTIKRKGTLPPYQYIIATSDRFKTFSLKYGLY